MVSDTQFAELEKYRNYLRLLVRMSLDPVLTGKVDASDVVQETMLEAYRDFERFRGCSNGERVRWLRQILANNLADQVRRYSRQKRDAFRERSMHASIDNSSCQLQHFLLAKCTTPSLAAVRNEDLLRMARALARLPSAQQKAITLHHLQGHKISEVARQLGRTDVAVAGLLRRGLKTLRDAFQED